ncbi:FixH family protein [Xanthomonadaceae bacterium JHOS43]|nr:FixH family protein [Xanthomonadaceae bacterium JHOS43]MCX7562368.1 FixH family protein [Xanthomonadaceae bacterium XH05]
MNTMMQATASRPWYREPMVWMVWGLPAIVVVAALATVTIAVRAGGTDVWPAQVRRTAQVQVEDLAADRTAIAMNLKGALAIDQATGAIRLRLENVPATTLQLRLDLIHPARAEGDMQLSLVRSGDQFLGRLGVSATQVWSVQVSDPDGTWRVAGRFEPGRGEVLLMPALSEGS